MYKLLAPRTNWQTQIFTHIKHARYTMQVTKNGKCNKDEMREMETECVGFISEGYLSSLIMQSDFYRAGDSSKYHQFEYGTIK